MPEQLQIPGLADDQYLLADGRILASVHSGHECQGRPCPVHRQSARARAIGPQHWRDDRGIMERICGHGVGHPDPDSPWPENSIQWVHGCDGCCAREATDGTDQAQVETPQPCGQGRQADEADPGLHSRLVLTSRLRSG